MFYRASLRDNCLAFCQPMGPGLSPDPHMRGRFEYAELNGAFMMRPANPGTRTGSQNRPFKTFAKSSQFC